MRLVLNRIAVADPAVKDSVSPENPAVTQPCEPEVANVLRRQIRCDPKNRLSGAGIFSNRNKNLILSGCPVLNSSN